jgi:hypothetical protein
MGARKNQKGKEMAEGGKEMIEETNWKQYLTEEVLKEIWHELKIIAGESKCSCGTKYWLPSSYDCSNRTFDNRNDLMDLYEAIFKKGKEENQGSGGKQRLPALPVFHAG